MYRVTMCHCKGEKIMVGNLNFRNFKSIEKFLYKTSKDLEKGKITHLQANANAKIADSWIRTHKLSQESEIIRRLDGIEEILKLQKKTKSPDSESEESSESK
jgi:hypothetical protein